MLFCRTLASLLEDAIVFLRQSEINMHQNNLIYTHLQVYDMCEQFSKYVNSQSSLAKKE